MVIICQQCSTRLQLDDAKVPARSFTVRCPKCQQIIKTQPPTQAPDFSALGVGDVSAPTQSRFGRPLPAPAFRPDAEGTPGDAPSVSNKDEVTRLLSSLLQQAMTTAASEASQTAGRAGWGGHRRALICASPEHRYAVARVLVENGYEVFVAEDTTQAIERMREDQMDVILLASDFDPQEQGAAFINREMSALRPAARRRTFLIHMTLDVRTGDQHAALIRSANFVLNPAEIEELPRTLDRAIRDFNALYRNYNQALQLQGI